MPQNTSASPTVDDPEVAPGVTDDGEYIRIRKSDLPEVAVVDGYWQVSWGRETTREEGPESFRDDALLALAQSTYAAEHPEDF